MTTRRNAVLHHAPRNQMNERENGREAAFSSAPIADGARRQNVSI
jgi:hypothetical protein